jgi:hypothetical protein
MLEGIIKASRYFMKSRGDGCRSMSQVAATTYGWAALPFALNSFWNCGHPGHYGGRP